MNWRKLFNKDELDWFMRLGKSITDPEKKKAFFNGIIESKIADPMWNIFEYFPREDIQVENTSESARLAKHYGDAILLNLRGRGYVGEEE